MTSGKLTSRELAFAALGRWISKHPYHPIVAWIIILVIAIPTLSLLGNVTTNSATVLPNNSPSVVAGNELAELFPNQSANSSSLIAVGGKDITGPTAQTSVVQLTEAIESDPSVQELIGVSTLYTSYAGYLDGEAQLADGFIQAAEKGGNQSLYSEVNGTSMIVWGPPALFVQAWFSFKESYPDAPISTINYDAFQQANMTLGSITEQGVASVEQNVLLTFYDEFNSSSICTSLIGPPPVFVSCADGVARKALPPLIESNVTELLNPILADTVLANLSIENFTSLPAVRTVAAGLLSMESGLGQGWLALVWNDFPGTQPNPQVLSAWSLGIADNETVANYPLPIPYAISSTFVDPAGNMTLILLNYATQDDYTLPNGSTPVFNNVGILSNLITKVFEKTDPSHTLSTWQTGEAPLDLDENNVLSNGLVYTLPLAVAVLLIITGLYFRSPLTPLATFGPIGMALVIAMGGTFVIGTLITKVDVTTLTLQDAFVLGVGADYAIFLFSRYREELRRGTPHQEAVVTTVTWAGESIAISGVTVMISTLALAFSGVALLSEWGMVLSLSVLIALLVAITVVPSILTLVGPRIFWPDSGKRFERTAQTVRQKMKAGKTYFQRAGRFSVKNALPVVIVAAAITVPLGYVALTAPVSYDFFGQLPSSAPSSQGLSKLAGNFGPGYAFPIQILVTFKSPLSTSNGINEEEIQDIANLSSIIGHTSGIVSVDSPTTQTGAPLSEWLSYSTLPPATQIELTGVLSSYVGTDGRTVLFTAIPSESGLSAAAISSMLSIEGRIGNYGDSHTEVSALAYGGAASELHDLDVQTSQALEKMIIIVIIGLLAVLLALFASLAIPILAIVTISTSIAWAWASTYLVMTVLLSTPIFFFDRVVLFVIVLGLGMDYNIFILTRIREEKSKDFTTKKAVVRAVGYTGGIITAAALILASVFFVLATNSFALLRTIGFSLGLAVVLDAMVVRTFLMPALMSLMGERVWWVPGRKKQPMAPEVAAP